MAYRLGIFPWYSEETPILWWSPDPRLVLFPEELKVSHSLSRVIKKGVFKVTTDRAFLQVIKNCAMVRRKQSEGTWILPEIVDAYYRLHLLGYAHSAESWLDGELVGGLYGISIGGAFFGESMFAQKTDASKVAFVHFVKLFQQLGVDLIDCQMTTSHLMSFGAREIPRSEFMERLSGAIERDLVWKGID